MSEEMEVPETPKRKGGRPRGPAKKAEPSGMTPEQVTAMMTTLVTEMKKPSELEQKKLEDEQRRRVVSAKARAEESRRTAEEKRQQIAACKHQRPDERHTFVGQVCSDGFIRGTCVRCPYEFGPIKATEEQTKSGVNLNLLPDLTAAKLDAWTSATMIKHPEATHSQPSWKIA
jgi:hypothetical protein